MILTTFDVDLEIKMNTAFLEWECLNLETGQIDYELYLKRQEEIINAAWKKQDEIMKMELDSMIEAAEAQADFDMRCMEIKAMNSPSAVPDSFFYALAAAILLVGLLLYT